MIIEFPRISEKEKSVLNDMLAEGRNLEDLCKFIRRKYKLIRRTAEDRILFNETIKNIFNFN